MKKNNSILARTKEQLKAIGNELTELNKSRTLTAVRAEQLISELSRIQEQLARARWH